MAAAEATEPRFRVLEGWVERIDIDAAVVKDKISDLSQRIQRVAGVPEQLQELSEVVTTLRVEMAALKTRVAMVGGVLALALPTITTLLIKLLGN